MTSDRLIGISHIRGGHNITLVIPAAKYLGVEDGDYVGFYAHKDGLLITKIDAKKVKPKGSGDPNSRIL